MGTLYLILMIMGLGFVLIGGTIMIVFGMVGGAGGFLAIPGLFIILGFGFIGGVIYMKGKESRIRKKGNRYSAKIYGYREDHSIVVNGAYPVNVVVHYFDDHRVEREAVIPTQFSRGSSKYAIGMTMDIFEYQGKFQWDPDSVRDEILPGERELMDDKPIDPAKQSFVGIQCPGCGASFKAMKGYANKCPYCGNQINA